MNASNRQREAAIQRDRQYEIDYHSSEIERKLTAGGYLPEDIKYHREALIALRKGGKK